eukprot:CAMPEP_0114561374 /NCGR_PEP_ID=MMETSP0114-20121206/11970_1 /TAXON_ID=31324 /ORGANISM="Goniomonas sp, Strain m" /LENGTH=151 /DNA_ID=CAMNT_0001747005 /DNA_START=50 /DNA_END=505 /DNA_ORIENTATION=-
MWPFSSNSRDAPPDDGCHYSTSTESQCRTDENGRFQCETFKRVFRKCPGKQLEELTEDGTRPVPEVGNPLSVFGNFGGDQVDRSFGFSLGPNILREFHDVFDQLDKETRDARNQDGERLFGGFHRFRFPGKVPGTDTQDSFSQFGDSFDEA